MTLNIQTNSNHQELESHKTGLNKPKPTIVHQEHDLDKPVKSNLPETDHFDEQETQDSLDDMPLSTLESSEMEAFDFSQQTSLMEEEGLDTTEEDPLDSETEDPKESEGSITGLTPQEENQIIANLFPLVSVLADYGVEPRTGGVECPFCGHPSDFTITKDGNTWWCETCSNTAHDTIEFVGKAEGITRIEARKFLIKKAGY